MEGRGFGLGNMMDSLAAGGGMLNDFKEVERRVYVVGGGEERSGGHYIRGADREGGWEGRG